MIYIQTILYVKSIYQNVNNVNLNNKIKLKILNQKNVKIVLLRVYIVEIHRRRTSTQNILDVMNVSI